MKKKYLGMAIALTLAGSMMFSSCIGSFRLSNKLMSWNQTIGSKFVNELVFFAFWILPVYEVSGLADLLVLNSIEFWSGENPVAENGEQIIEGNDSKYLVKTDEAGYTITSLTDGSEVRLDYDKDDNSWNATVDDQTVTIFTFVDDTHVNIITPDGSYRLVELSHDGVLAYSDIIIAKTKRATFKNETSKTSLFSLPFFSYTFDRLNIN